MPDEPTPAPTPEEPDAPLNQQIAGAIAEEPDAGATPPPDAGAAPAPAAEEDPVIDFEGTQLRRSEVQALLDFRSWAAQNPQLIADFNDLVEGRRRLVPIDEPPAAPQAERQPVPPGADLGGAPIELTEEDLADLPPNVRAKLGQIDTLQQIVAGLQNQTFEDVRSRNLTALAQASSNFAQRYGLSEAEVEQLERQVAQAGILPSMVQAAGRDLVRGTEDALEVMYFRSPAGRQREIERMQTANREALNRQRKAGKLAGSGGSSPRTPEPEVLTPDARKQAMIDEIARAQRGGTE